MIKPKKSVEEMQAYAVDLYKPTFKYKLDENENQYGPSPKVLEVFSKTDATSIKFYPCYGKLLEKLSEFNNIPKEYFLNTNGADEAINVIFSTYLEKGSKVLTVKPSFSMPKIYAQICGAEYIEIPYKEKWKFPKEEFLATIKANPDLKIIHLTTPNNPTGDCIQRSLIEEIINYAKDKIVVIDETYANYSSTFNSDLVLNNDNVIVVRSFSKDFALAGLRAGYVISNPYNIEQMNKVRSPYSTNSVAMRAAIAALDDYAYFKDIYQKLKQTKSKLETMLKSFGFEVYESSSNFSLVNFGEKGDFIYKQLLKNSIKIRKFDNNELMKNIFRISIPTEEGFSAIKNVFDNLQKDTLILDMDGVLADVSNSYRLAIKNTYEFFAKKELKEDRIAKAKNLGGLNNDWDLTEYLLKNDGFNIAKEEIISQFQKIYWNEGKGLILSEKLLIDKKLLEDLSNKFNLAVFTGRPKPEALFMLNHNDIEKYFDCVITMDDLPSDKQKPNPLGINLIKEKINCRDIFYFGDTPDDIKCGISANVKAVGVLPPQDKTVDLKKQMLEKNAIDVIDSINDLLKVVEK